MNTQIPTGSTSKWPSAMMFASLVSDGTIASLDDPVSKYLDYWTTSKHDNRSKVTVRMLLTFTSGFGDGHPGEDGGADYQAPLPGDGDDVAEAHGLQERQPHAEGATCGGRGSATCGGEWRAGCTGVSDVERRRARDRGRRTREAHSGGAPSPVPPRPRYRRVDSRRQRPPLSARHTDPPALRKPTPRGQRTHTVFTGGDAHDEPQGRARRDTGGQRREHVRLPFCHSSSAGCRKHSATRRYTGSLNRTRRRRASGLSPP